MDNQENTGNVLTTTDLPDPVAYRKNIARKRVFYVLLGFCVVLLGLLAWEIVDLCIGIAK